MPSTNGFHFFAIHFQEIPTTKLHEEMDETISSEVFSRILRKSFFDITTYSLENQHIFNPS